MDDSETGNRTGAPRNGSIPTGEIDVLYVDGDDEAWLALGEHVDHSETVRVEQVTDPAAARSLVERGGIDVIVVTADVPGGEGDPLLETATPTILYTDIDPWNIDDSVLGAVDSLVEKDIADSERYLVEKIEGMVAGPGAREDFSAGALARLDDDVGDTIGLFLLDDSGIVLWQSQSADTLFKRDDSDDEDVDRRDFYAHLAHLLGDQPDTLATLLGVRNDDTDSSHLVEITGDEGPARFFHASYSVDSGLAGDRFVVFVPLSAVVDRYERLELFEELVDNAKDGLFVLDADGRIEYCNQSYAGMVGYDPDELVGRHASAVIAEGEIESGQAAVSEALGPDGAARRVDMTLKHRDGSEVHTSIHGSVRRDSSGTYAGLMGVIRDITERKERERELEEYRTLVENAVDPMYVVDENGTIQVVNESMTEFVGRKKADIVGADVRDILPLESINAGRGVLRRILSDDEVENESFEMWMTNADGEKRFFEVTISAITENGEFGGSVATYRDITERHRRQEQLDLRKQIFARSLRHNIRNETSIIHSYGTILADELDGEHAAMAEAILDASQSLAGTSRKVSQFDWLVEKEPELVDHDLFALVKRSIEQVRSTTDDANISIEIPDGLQVRAVRDLDVAIKNLVENALQHGTTDSAPSVSVTARETTESVTLVVADDGPGIPQQEIAVIEEGRETALDHASGLGLWLVKRVITQSGGDLSFEVGDGTRVEVTFPRVPDTQ
jgi:PAS domain S-box-containing protein